MVIYLDTLIFTNVIIDYLLLCATSLIVKKNYKIIRVVLASLLGGVESLYIFVETDFLILDLAFKVISCGVMIFIVNGLNKGFGLTFLVFLGLSFSLSGAVMFLCNLINIKTVYSENFINYFNISPILLILLTALIYLFIKIIQRILMRRKNNFTANLILKICGVNFEYKALVDSGNNVCDPFGDSQVFIIEKDELNNIFSKISKEQLEIRKRIIPIKTVSESGILEGLRFDSATIVIEKEKYIFNNPIIVFSTQNIENDFKAIVPIHAVNRLPD